MGEAIQSDGHVFHLSSIDQASERVYIRYCLCFPCDGNEIDSITSRLTASVKHTVLHLPMLAGVIRPAEADQGDQSGRLEVAVTLKQVLDFVPATKILIVEEFRHSYPDLHDARMPPATLIDTAFTPLPDIPDARPTPVFAVQATFISGGVVVALYLHHSAADIFGLQTIIGHLSRDLPSRTITEDDIHEETVEQSRLRDRLSGSRGAKVGVADVDHTNTRTSPVDGGLGNLSLRSDTGTCRTVSFNLKIIKAITSMANEHLHYVCDDAAVHLSAFHVLAAILWKGVNRALLQTRALLQEKGQSIMSSVAIPTNIRKTIEPPLEDSYVGNAEIHGIATTEAVRLAMPFDPAAVAYIARLICTSLADISEKHIRAKIAGINGSSHIDAPPRQPLWETASLVLTDWTGMRLEGATLGLGLGSPEWARKVGQGIDEDECIVHPAREEEGVWEVTLELPKEVMGALLKDESLMAFVGRIV